MKAKGKFTSALLVIDTFFVSYAVGFNSQHVLIVDPEMPAYVQPAAAAAAAASAATPRTAGHAPSSQTTAASSGKEAGDASSALGYTHSIKPTHDKPGSKHERKIVHGIKTQAQKTTVSKLKNAAGNSETSSNQ